ncbi:response regulator [Pseudomonas sp. OHS18]|uniref:response regulator n=1 Tax=Pseudomonas sp. OHS18 TaxID=3399679 RepID=UPI003A859C03
MSSSILLVEDESLDLELALIALKRARMDSEFTAVRDGQQAMDNLFCQNSYANREPDNPRPRHPRLAPNFTGLQVLAAMRGCVDLRDMPVVVMTTRAIQWSQQKAHELNVSAYIVKPLALEDYLEVVASLSTLLAPDGAPNKPQTKPHWR